MSDPNAERNSTCLVVSWEVGGCLDVQLQLIHPVMSWLAHGDGLELLATLPGDVEQDGGLAHTFAAASGLPLLALQ